MSLDSTLAAGRAAAQTRMTSRCTIRRKTGEAAQNESTGLVTPTWGVTYTDLPVRVGGQPRGASPSRTLVVAGVELEVASRVAHLPYDTSDLRDGDHIEITSGDSSGLVLRVVDADWQDQATARRVLVLAVDRPEEWA